MSSRLVVAAIALSLVLLAIPPLCYVAQFGTRWSPDQEVWGQFGDFVGGTINPLVSALGLLGVAASLYYARQALVQGDKRYLEEKGEREQQSRRDRAFDAWRLWMSPEMQATRARAWDWIQNELKEQGPSRPLYMAPHRDAKDPSQKQNYRDFSTVYHFFADICVECEAKVIDEALIAKLLGRDYLTWINVLRNCDFRGHADDLSERSAKANRWYEKYVYSLERVFQKCFSDLEVEPPRS